MRPDLGQHKELEAKLRRCGKRWRDLVNADFGAVDISYSGQFVVARTDGRFVMKVEIAATLREAKALIGVRWECSSDSVLNVIDEWVKELLQPLSDTGNTEAKYMLATLYDGHQSSEITAEEFDERLLQKHKQGAKAEIPEAMFYLGHWHWERGQHKEAAKLYERAASTGHAHAMWCHGLDLLAGTGVEQNTKLGLEKIEKAAELKFEGAVQFMANAYAMGQYGLPQDEKLAAKWLKELSSPSLIGF